MIRKKEWMFALILFTYGLCLLSSCKNGVELKKINGVLEEPVTIQLPEHLKKAYETAVKEKYRFFSFGDAMMIKRKG